MEKYLKKNLACNLTHSPSKFYKRENPEISIVISTFNGEVYLKPIVRSVQNQNFLNIEIIIVDDGSMDKSVEVVKELMNEDRRIKLLTNGINRGTLYTKTRGVLNAKGKYVMTLDHDNLYATEDAFSELYRKAKQYNLDLVGFGGIVTAVEVKNIPQNNILNYIKTGVIKKPDIKRRFLGPKIISSTLLWLYFIKTNFFIKVIKIIGDDIINRNIDAHDDSILIFALSRNALSLKHLNDIFYTVLAWPLEYSERLKFQTTIKFRERERKNCYSFLTAIEALLFLGENDDDKIIAENWLSALLLNHDKCRNNTDVKNDAIRVCNLFLNNEYISSKTKNEIYLYLNQTKQLK